MAGTYSAFRDSSLARFDLPERALLVRLRFLGGLMDDAYRGLKNCRSRSAFRQRLQGLCWGPIPQLFPELGKRITCLLQYLQKADSERALSRSESQGQAMVGNDRRLRFRLCKKIKKRNSP